MRRPNAIVSKFSLRLLSHDHGHGHDDGHDDGQSEELANLMLV